MHPPILKLQEDAWDANLFATLLSSLKMCEIFKFNFFAFCNALNHRFLKRQGILPAPLLNKLTRYMEFVSTHKLQWLNSEVFSIPIMKSIIPALKAKQTPIPYQKKKIKLPLQFLKKRPQTHEPREPNVVPSILHFNQPLGGKF